MATSSDEEPTRFPTPLVGAAVILAVLIVLTPVLISGGGGAGALLAQATLIIDHAGGGLNTSFTVEGVGVVRYAEIHIGINVSYSPGTPLKWVNWSRWVNASNVVSSYISTSATNVAVNVSAYYISSTGARGWYYGIVSSVYDPPMQTLTLSALTSGLAVPGGALSTVGNRFPIAIALAYQASSGIPP